MNMDMIKIKTLRWMCQLYCVTRNRTLTLHPHPVWYGMLSYQKDASGSSVIHCSALLDSIVHIIISTCCSVLIFRIHRKFLKPLLLNSVNETASHNNTVKQFASTVILFATGLTESI